MSEQELERQNILVARQLGYISEEFAQELLMELREFYSNQPAKGVA